MEIFSKITRDNPAHLQEIALHLRTLILRTNPALRESVHGGGSVAIALYEHPETGMACGIQCGPKDCKLYLHKFSSFSTSVYKLEGSGAKSKHIKFTEMAQVNEAELQRLLGIVMATPAPTEAVEKPAKAKK